MSIDYGFDFRATSGYVSDPTNCTAELEASYPHTYTFTGGATGVAGWETGGLSQRDRDSTLDPRIAGLVFNGGAGGDNFRVDLPSAGTYDIYAGFGDPTFGQTINLLLRDGTTTFATISGTTGGSQLMDAAGNFWSTAAWPGSNVKITQTFSSTILRVKDNGAGSGIWLSHLRVATAAGSTFDPSAGFPWPDTAQLAVARRGVVAYRAWPTTADDVFLRLIGTNRRRARPWASVILPVRRPSPTPAPRPSRRPWGRLPPGSRSTTC